ncbi:MAG: glycosyltransferase family 2 protein [Oligoflexales bacterium]
MLNIVIPMAGRGSRFQKEGFTLPKPLIPVRGVPMIHLVVDQLTPKQDHRFIFLCLEEHLENYQVTNMLKKAAPGCLIVPVREVTEGAACTVLLAEKHIDNDDGLMIANSDQWVDLDINDYLQAMDDGQFQGFIMTMKADDPKWSFIEYDSNKKVIGVVEKKVVSDDATVGIYNFAKGSDFVKHAKNMIQQNLRVNGEFYVAPVYTELVRHSGSIGIHNVGSEYNGMHGLGIPSDLAKFEETNVAQRAVAHLDHFDYTNHSESV